ncbi:MAG: glutathione S-transferase family protein [Minwuia sp.]|uniref:glutathione S-transferase family protein n=1 Tax=Minwuia sp. TaxID=2493630 RepID=UPI003A88D1A6
MEILADPITVNCRKVLAGLKMIGSDYTLTKVDYFQGEQKSPEYVAINPNASIPAMRDGDLVLWESNAILQYAADKAGNAGAYPTDLKTRADINRWLLWECGSWFPSCYVYLVENCVKPLLGAETDPAVLEGEAENFHKLAGILDNRLATSTWICGDSPTIADVVVASPMHLHGWQKLPLDNHRNIVRWMTRNVEAAPWWKATHVEEGFKLPEAA